MATRQTKLRAVQEDERHAPLSVADASDFGTAIDELRAIRTVLARAIDSPNTSPRDLAALTRRQLEVSREIRALELKAKEEAADAEDAEDEGFDAEAI